MTAGPTPPKVPGPPVKRGAHPLTLIVALAALVASSWALSIAIASTSRWIGLARWAGTLSCLGTGAFVLAVLYWVVSQTFEGRRRRLERVVEGQCMWCGYDLRECRGRCPECGKAIPEFWYSATSQSRRNPRRTASGRPTRPAPTSRTGG